MKAVLRDPGYRKVFHDQGDRPSDGGCVCPGVSSLMPSGLLSVILLCDLSRSCCTMAVLAQVLL